METRQVPYYSVVLFRGSMTRIAKAKKALESRGVPVFQTGPTTLGLKGVRSSSTPTLRKISATFGLTDPDLRGRYLKAEASPSKEPPKLKKQARTLNLQPQKWYYAEAVEDRYPLVFVRQAGDVENEQYWDVDLLDPQNSLPKRVVVPAATLASFGLRPATMDDFEELDLPAPYAKHLAYHQGALPNLNNLDAFRGAATEGPEIDSTAKMDFLELTQTQLADWQPNADGILEAYVQDEDLVQRVGELVGEWAAANKFPKKEVDASGDTKKWTFTTPGTSAKPVLVLTATKETDGDEAAVGPWKVSIEQLWA